MNRSQLIDAVADVAAAAGYPFAAIAPHQVPTAVKSLPMALLESPEFLKIEGKTGGRITYAIRLHLLLSPTSQPTESRYRVESQAEAQLLDMLTQLSDNQCVDYVDKVEITPSVIGSTVGCTATAEVVIEF